MRRLWPLAFVLLSGCGAATPTNPAQATTGALPTTGGQATGTTPTAAPGQSTTAPGVAIPAACLAGFTAYLKLIEPVVADFDDATSVFGDFYGVDEAANEKGIQAMTANGGRATYSCSEVGLEFNYFDAKSPWPAILELAAAQAPGTLSYLQVKQKVAAIDNAVMADYGVASCVDAVARIAKGVADASAAGEQQVGDMSVDAGLALFGLYGAYLSDVQDGKCPPDVLGNAEFDFLAQP